MSQDWIIIGISGVTCGGKTTLANRLKDKLVPVHVFHQDKYFYPDDSPNHIKCEGLDHNNYDILSALDMDKMYDDIVRTMKGDVQSHASNLDEEPGKLQMCGKKFLVIEGFTVLNYKPILELCTLRYFFVLEFGECLARRVHRLYEPPDVPGYFERCVWPEHLLCRAEIEKDSRVRLLDATRPDALESVLAELQQVGAREVTG